MSTPDFAARGRIGAYVQHSRHDARQTTAAARAQFLARFEQQVDPKGALPTEEGRRRAAHARRAHMARLAIRSGQVRKYATRSVTSSTERVARRSSNAGSIGTDNSQRV
jgi:hypothetical protein